MTIVVLLLQWFHVLLGVFWFGSVLYLNVALIPTILRLPVEQQRTISVPLGIFTDRILTPVSILVILLGLVRGTWLGPIHALSYLFGTSYGLTFLVATLLTIGLALWGTFVSGRAAKRLNAFPLQEVMQANGAPSATFSAQLQRVKLFVLLELAGFFLDAATKRLHEEEMAETEATVSYEAPQGGVTFLTDPFSVDTEITGPLALHLWVSS